MHTLKFPLSALLRLCLLCILLGGCVPGSYISRQAAEGVVVDAVSRQPLSGVQVSYGDESLLTDGSGGFSFSQQTSIAMFYMGGEHPAWPHWGHLPLSFSKEGYVTLCGSVWKVAEQNGTVALEPAAIPEGIAALDKSITQVRIMHRPDGGVVVWLTIECEGDFAVLPDLAEHTRDLAEKVSRSGLADPSPGRSPDLAFTFIRYREDPQRGKVRLWDAEIGWTGEALRIMNLQRNSPELWLNIVAFVQYSQELEPVFSSFKAERDNARVYSPFFEKITSRTAMPNEFYDLKRREW